MQSERLAVLLHDDVCEWLAGALRFFAISLSIIYRATEAPTPLATLQLFRIT
jgi:hypothetical protein